MKVPNDPKVFDQLRCEVLESCPSEATASFKAGHEYYAKTFFEELKIHSNIFFDLVEGTCILDLDFLKVDSRQLTLEYMSNYHTHNQSEFIMGVDFSETVTTEILIFALAMKPATQAA